MVRCVYCPNLDRKTRKCAYYSKKLGKDFFIALKDIHKQIPCEGYGKT